MRRAVAVLVRALVAVVAGAPRGASDCGAALQGCGIAGLKPCATFGRKPCVTFGRKPCATFGLKPWATVY